MTDKKTYVLLAEQQIKTLIGQGCTAVDWNQVKVTSTFDPFRVRNTHFSGSVSIGRLDKTINLSGGFERKAGIYNATVHNCNIGDNVFNPLLGGLFYLILCLFGLEVKYKISRYLHLTVLSSNSLW